MPTTKTVHACRLTNAACVVVQASPKARAIVMATCSMSVVYAEALAFLKELVIATATHSTSVACVADKASPKALATVKATCLTNVAFAEVQELQKVSATATETCLTRVEFAVATATSVVPILKLAIMMRELAVTMVAVMFQLRTVQNAWMACPP